MKTMHSIALALLLLIHSIHANPRNVSIQGVVTDSVSGKQLAGATVTLIQAKKKDVVHADGTFHFNNIASGSYNIGVRYLGYKDKIVPVTASADTIIYIQLVASSIQTSEVIITEQSNRTTQSATQQSIVLNSEEVDRHRGQTIGETIAQVPGVTLLTTGSSIAKPVIRGLHSQRIATINNGVQQEGQQWGQEHAPEIDPFTVDRIEVLKGAAGVEYGANAIGGVVRVDSRELPFNQSVEGNFSLVGFSNNRQISSSLSLESGETLLNQELAWRVLGSFRRAGDSHSAEYNLSNTGFREYNALATAGWKKESSSFQALYSIFSSSLGILSSSHIGTFQDLQRAIQTGRPLIIRDFTYDIGFPRQSIQHQIASAMYKTLLPTLGNLELLYSFQRNDREEYDAHNSRISDSTLLAQYLSKPAMELSLASYALQAKLHHFEIGAASGTVGLSAQRQSNIRGGRVKLIPDFVSYNTGFYIIENVSMEDWVFNAGARFDYSTNDVVRGTTSDTVPNRVHTFTALSGALGVRKLILENSSLSLNLTTGWRPPQVNELYSNDVHHGTAQFEIGDSSLVPERSLSADLTASLQFENVHINTSAYVNSISNYIFTNPDRANTIITVRGVFPLMRYSQTNALFWGAEFAGDVDVTSTIRFGLNGSMVRATDTHANTPIIFIPADRIKLYVHAHQESIWSLHDAFAELSTTIVREQTRFPSDVDYTNPPKGYVLVNAQTGAEFPLFGLHTTLTLEVQNLLNTSYRDYLSRYRYFALDVGRNIILRLSLPLQS